jgi:hypothetical protein
MNNGTNVFPTQPPLDFSHGELKIPCVEADTAVGVVTAAGAIVSGSGYTPGANPGIILTYMYVSGGAVGSGAGAVAAVTVWVKKGE